MSNKKENWKAITVDNKKPPVPYMISSHGRLGVKLGGKIEVRKVKTLNSVRKYNFRMNGKNKTIILKREVAKAFVSKPSPKHQWIVYKDHNYSNNNASNLKWVTKKEHGTHVAQSPGNRSWLKRRVAAGSVRGKVLNEKKVREIKEILWSKNPKLNHVQIAKKYKVSKMQIHRIKKGEFWYHVHVKNEPLHEKYTQNLKRVEWVKKQNKGVKK